jgi:hypothetical protein
MRETRLHVFNSEQYRAYPKPESLQAMSLGMLENYYANIQESIVIDKSRDWPIPENFAMLKSVLPYRPKFILTVRSILEVLASFVKLAESSNNKDNMLDANISSDRFNFYRPINDIRCDYLMSPKGVIDNSLYGIANALANPEQALIIEYESLVRNPQLELSRVYSFLEVPEFSHSFDDISNTVQEDDSI